MVEYVRRQKEHHKKMSFIDELKQIMREVGIQYDEDYFRKDWIE
ncbi:hypothetical protein HMPREF9135_0560 [Segatella baroniae F0067]|uniref:Uncharacterized protein n=1 Tax=Segatella baroniae F0067 TaxID=1115809 RepID=U2P9E1_9BACT|nr:hypothetical protein HMPREF9135_0560 [Segatella baroniae F0067]